MQLTNQRFFQQSEKKTTQALGKANEAFFYEETIKSHK
jgi:hypothetical protein